MKRADQERALDLLRTDPSLASLNRLEAPYLDLEVRGIPALQYFGRMVRGAPGAPRIPDDDGDCDCDCHGFFIMVMVVIMVIVMVVVMVIWFWS